MSFKFNLLEFICQVSSPLTKGRQKVSRMPEEIAEIGDNLEGTVSIREACFEGIGFSFDLNQSQNNKLGLNQSVYIQVLRLNQSVYKKLSLNQSKRRHAPEIYIDTLP